ncbi:MAG: glycosyltransferase family 2 protein [Nitrospirae bacterium]|nr:glycosyltransferase family 2 protein [Nitrospirota bacterium]
MKGRDQLSIVIPVFNEARAIHFVVEETLAACEIILRSLPKIRSTEVLLIDDGSDDGTADVLSSLTGVGVLRHPHRRGYGAALRTGFAAARGTVLAMLDGDHSYPPGALSALVQETLSSDAELVIGARYGDFSGHLDPIRKLGNRLFRAAITLLYDHRLIDPTSGMRSFRRGFLEEVGTLPDGFDYGLAMTLRAVARGIRIGEMHIQARARIGRSKLHIPTQGARFLLTIVREYRAVGSLRALSRTFPARPLTSER